MVGSARAKARFKACLTIISQNCRGLKTRARIDEVICALSNRGAFLACVQETWRPGEEEQLCQDGWLYLGVGPPQQLGRGSKGVGMFLSQPACRAVLRRCR